MFLKKFFLQIAIFLQKKLEKTIIISTFATDKGRKPIDDTTY